MGLETEKQMLDNCEEKDLGVYADPKLNFSIHCQKVAAKTNSIMGIVLLTTLIKTFSINYTKQSNS